MKIGNSIEYIISINEISSKKDIDQVNQYINDKNLNDKIHIIDIGRITGDTNVKGLFSYFPNLEIVRTGPIDNAESVTGMFNNCPKLRYIIIGSTPKLTELRDIAIECPSIESITVVSTGEIEDLHDCFINYPNLKHVAINHTKCTRMHDVFRKCPKLNFIEYRHCPKLKLPYVPEGFDIYEMPKHSFMLEKPSK